MAGDLMLLSAVYAVLTGAFRAEAPFAFTGSAPEAYALMDHHMAKLLEKEAQVSSS